MEKYSLILINNTKASPRVLGLENVNGPRVPIKGEIISSEALAGYIMSYADKEMNTGYISNFSYSDFIVDKVTHAPENNGGELEVKVIVEAIKIPKKK